MAANELSGIRAACLRHAKAEQEKGLRHEFGAGQMAMVAVGGSIGTGLMLGSAAALEIAGPGVILSFALAALITLTVTLALGELSSMHPGAGSFGLYGDLYVNEWAGFIARAGYWAALSISIGAELVASATYLAYWFPSVPALVWAAIFSVLLLLINLRTVGNYRTLRILVRTHQGCDDFRFCFAGSIAVADWTRGTAIHDTWRLSSQGPIGATAGDRFRSLYIRGP